MSPVSSKAGAQATVAPKAAPVSANATTAAATVATRSPAAGAWLLRYNYQPRAQHGKTPEVEVIEAQLTLRAVGDSLFGEWQRSSPPGEPAFTPYNVSGIQRGDSVFLRMIKAEDKDASLFASAMHDIAEFMRTYVHGVPPTATAIAAAIRGDVFSGTRQTVLLDGTPNGKAEPMTGVRSKP